MKKYLKRSTLLAACIVSLTVGVTADMSRAENITARENLEILKKTNSCRGCDLSGLTLNRMNFAGADLEGADFSMAKFFLSNLAGANLRNSNLKGASFGGTDLSEADLRGADLRGTSLDGAYLDGTLLDGEFITAKPYEDIGVPEVEKQIYIDDPGKPKKNPETREVKVAAPGDFEESSQPLAVDREAAESSSEKNPSAVVKRVKLPVNERQPAAPVAKKVAPVSQAIVEPLAKADKDKTDDKEKTVAEQVALKEPAKAQEKNTGNDQGNSKALLQNATPKIMADAGKPPAIIHADVKKKSSPKQETIKNVSPADVKEKAVAEKGVGESSALLAQEKSKRDNLTRLLDKDKCFECDLSGLDLSGKNLKGVDLEKADLTDCNLERATLDKANLKGAILRNANLRKAGLQNADLYKADLSGADLTGADVQGAKFDNAQITSAIGLEIPVSSKK